MEIAVSILSAVLSSGVVLFLVQRYFNRRDQREDADHAAREELYSKIEISLETIRLLAYHRMSEEIERLLTKGFATPSERRLLDEMHLNYKAHGWNGDMDARLAKVYQLRTDKPAANK